MKPKINRAGDAAKSNKFDRCNTPSYALDPLLPFLRPEWSVWECAQGTGNLVRALAPHVQGVIGTDLAGDPPVNFFTWQPPAFDAIVTNPPYSIKYDWLARCYDLGKPFALLVPVETIGAWKAQRLFREFGFEWLFLNRRVNFEMPDKGYNGKGAQFPVLWCCWKLLPAPVLFGGLARRDDRQLAMWQAA